MSSMTTDFVPVDSGSSASSFTDNDGPGSFRAVFQANMPNSKKPLCHTSVSVLLLSYQYEENFTDMDVRPEVDQLESVFKNDYGFEVQQRFIGSDKDAHLQMMRHLIQFTLEHRDPQALLIVYYAGHASRSYDQTRENPGAYDLAPKRFEANEEKVVMWEACDNVLRRVKADVLVIFDCCDTGHLTKLRSGAHVFEYLGACSTTPTHGPGENSFTVALLWALRQMSSEQPFTTYQLLAKIKEHKLFPQKQVPVLFPRSGYLEENIWISKRRTQLTPLHERRHSSTAPELRDGRCDYVDLRITFGHALSDKDGKHARELAKLLAPIVRNRVSALRPRHVAFVDKGTCKPISAHWMRAWNHILALRQFQGVTSKRKRDMFESEPEDPDNRHKKASTSIDVELQTQYTAALLSKKLDSGSDGTGGLRIDTSFMITPAESPQPPENIEALLRELEKVID